MVNNLKYVFNYIYYLNNKNNNFYSNHNNNYNA